MSEHDPDAELLVRVARGEPLATRELVARKLPRLLSVAQRMLSSRAEAEEVAQEVFVRAWKQAFGWRTGDAKFDTWLHRVTLNLCYDRLRACKDDIPYDESHDRADDVCAFRAERRAGRPVAAHAAALRAGRTAACDAANGTGGTDHGTASTAMVLGGVVQGGRVLGDWPGLATASLYQQRDLMPTTNLDTLIAGVTSECFGIEPERVARTVFPGGTDTMKLPRLLRT